MIRFLSFRRVRPAAFCLMSAAALALIAASLNGQDKPNTPQKEPTASSDKSPSGGASRSGSPSKSDASAAPSTNQVTSGAFRDREAANGRNANGSSAPAAAVSEESTRRFFGIVPPEVAESANELANSSFNAFRRGLMPLSDHLDQLDIAWRAERRAAVDADALYAVDLQQIERLDSAVKALEEFNQPAAAGWGTELLLARAMRSEIRAFVLSGEGDDEAAQSEHAAALEFASQHLAQRAADGSGVLVPGLIENGRFVPAGLPLIVPESETDPEDFMRNPLMMTHAYALRTAENGRADAELLDTYEKERQAFRQSLEAETVDEADALAHFEAASNAAQRLFEQQLEFQKKGTASVYDVIRTLRLRNDLFDQAESMDLKVSSNEHSSRHDSLMELAELAEQKTDRRGRMTADVATIGLMVAYDDALTQSAKEDAEAQANRGGQQGQTNQGRGNSQPASTGSGTGPRVIELKPRKSADKGSTQRR